jgi:hypothetical protein
VLSFVAVPHLVHVYAHQRGESVETLRRALRDANGLQKEFKFELVRLDTGLSGVHRVINVGDLEQTLGELLPQIRGLVVCEESFTEGDLLVEKLPTRAYLSAHARLGQSPNDPSLRLFFLYQLIAAALTVGVGLPAAANDRMTHRPPVGCLWDWWLDANQRSAAMVAARICPTCEASLGRTGDVSEAALTAGRQILEYIRRTLLTGASEIPNKVFVAHGHGQDWETLVAMLREWNLPIDSFEARSTAGMLVPTRWQEMLNRARLAFALMTGDDPGASGDTKRARQNVIHEIGLCHARLGIFDTIVLIAEGTEKFSNIEGVIYIEFREGRLHERRDIIKGCLVERGILRGSANG